MLSETQIGVPHEALKCKRRNNRKTPKIRSHLYKIDIVINKNWYERVLEHWLYLTLYETNGSRARLITMGDFSRIETGSKSGTMI